ncbi:receptor-type tyrosine-protein phosphatase beta-like [Diadema setosum]|uniref:receptor-type tyrosine-protein phosphatase beta-like n=1 Tax=Diadema setosum TaxID=31175 RepID=UPI003B3AC316
MTSESYSVANLIIHNEGSTDSLNVMWTPPSGAESQNVSWYLADGDVSNDMYVAMLAGWKSRYLIENLTAGALYNVTVTAYNDTNSSSAEEQGRTLPNQAVLIPGDSTTHSVSSSWDKPAGVVVQYNISCNNGTASPATMDADSDHPVNSSCTGLYQAGDEYIMTVIGISGYETNEASIMLRALPSRVVLIPGMPTSDTVTASWDKPAGLVEMYNISCSDGTASPATIDANNNHPVNASCTGLYQAGDEYIMTVTSISGDQTNEATITLRALPNQVVLTPGTPTNETVTASWDKPAGVVDQYNISCSSGTASPATIDADSDHPVIASCFALNTAGAKYTMTVTCISGDEINQATITLRALPNQVVLTPGTPTNETVTASWDKPSGVVDQYNISCSDGTASPATIDAISGDETNEASIMLRALPNQVVFRPGIPTNETVTASWDKPAGVVDQYNISCSDGTASLATIDANNNHPVNASCTGLYQAGDAYTMTVTSISGDETNEASIMLRALPNQVVFRPGIPTNETVTASWDKPAGVVDQYNISCSDGTASLATIDANNNHPVNASCTGLYQAGDAYTMTVTSISGDETNEASIMLRALPNQVVFRPGIPTNETVTASWDKPAGVVDQYNISCSDGTASPATIDADSDHPVNASCTGLYQAGDEYIMTVTSINGDQTNEASITLFTLPNTVVLVEGISTTDSVSANWVNPAGLVSSYTIECSNGTASPSSIDFTDEEQYNATCEGLSIPGANYTMTVTSFSNGENNSADIILTAAPLPPNLQPNVSTETSVSAVWRHPGGVIEKFEVKCSEGMPGDISEDYLGDEDLYRASCENVSTPGDTYLMTVTSISSRQENPATVNLTALPEAVTLREESSNTTAITASWEVPDSVLDTFIITCSDGIASPSEISVTNDQRGETFTASCIDLPTPGEEYNITVGSRSSGKESAPSSLGIIAYRNFC